MNFLKKRSPCVDGSLPVCLDLSGSLCCLTFSKKMMERAPLGRVEGLAGPLAFVTLPADKGNHQSVGRVREGNKDHELRRRAACWLGTGPLHRFRGGGGTWRRPGREGLGREWKPAGRSAAQQRLGRWVQSCQRSLWGLGTPASLPLQGRGLALLTASYSSPLGEAAELGAPTWQHDSPGPAPGSQRKEPWAAGVSAPSSDFLRRPPEPPPPRLFIINSVDACLSPP